MSDPERSTIHKPRLIKSADGTEICADAAGNRTAGCPVVVLIHGFSVIKEAFDPMFKDPQWVNNAFLVRYDTRGHGKSGKPLTDEAWESRRISEDFEAVCKEFRVREAFVLGWSLGATHLVDIVMYTTSVKIMGLINVEGIPYLDACTRVVDQTNFVFIQTLIQPSSVDAFQEAALTFVRLCSDVMPEELYWKFLEGVLVQSREVVSKLAARNQDREAEKFLRQARQGELPDVLVVGGGKDKLVNGKEVEAVYQDAGWRKYIFKHLEDADHLPWISRPEEFCDVVLGWVKERQMF